MVICQPHSPTEDGPSRFTIQLTLLASLGGVLFGYDLGAISGALPQLTHSFDLSDSQQEWVVSILYLGGGLGACVGGTLCDWMGRQRTIVGTDVIFCLGAIWLFWANSYVHVLVGRFVVGIAVAVSGVADVSYLHEIAPLEWRGAIVSVNEACISLGFLLAYVATFVYSNAEREEWRVVFGWAGILALIQGVGMWNMPESPIWLADKGRYAESRQAWQRINGIAPSSSSSSSAAAAALDSPMDRSGSDEPLDERQQQQQETEATGRTINDAAVVSYQATVLAHPHDDVTNDLDNVTDHKLHYHYYYYCCFEGRISWIVSQLQLTRETMLRYRRQVYVALFLTVTQQFCGQTNVLNYAPYIFEQAAGKDDPPKWSSVVIGVVKFAVTVLVIWRIEFVGRRTLLLSGMAMISIGMVALIVAFGGLGPEDPDNWMTNLKTFHLALPGVLLVVCGYSMSFGPLTWLLTSELFPTEIRGRALGASTIVTYLCASLVTRTFLSASSALGPSKVFGIYCVVTTMGILFAYLAIPDTGEKTPEQVDSALHSMWWWRYDAIALNRMETDEENWSTTSRPDIPPEDTATTSRTESQGIGRPSNSPTPSQSTSSRILGELA